MKCELAIRADISALLVKDEAFSVYQSSVSEPPGVVAVNLDFPAAARANRRFVLELELQD